MKKSYLIVIDMQKDFITGSLGSKYGQDIVNNVHFLGGELLINLGIDLNSKEEEELCKNLGIDIISIEN